MFCPEGGLTVQICSFYFSGPLDVTSENNPSLQSPDQQSSEETLATDPWMRSGTSDTFKCSDQPLRRRALDHIGPQS